jgi:HSP20 family molecular chaperone IbpA
MTIERFEDMTLYSNMSKNVTRKYIKPKNRRLRKAYSLFYKYSETILGEEDDKPKKQFVKNPSVFNSIDDNDYDTADDDDYDDTAVFHRALCKREDPLVEVITSKNQVKVVIEIPLMNKKDIKVNAYDGCLEVYAANIRKKVSSCCRYTIRHRYCFR